MYSINLNHYVTNQYGNRCYNCVTNPTIQYLHSLPFLTDCHSSCLTCESADNSSSCLTCSDGTLVVLNSSPPGPCVLPGEGVLYIAHKPPEYHTHRDFDIVYTDYSVRLVDGTASNEGRVEVVKSGQYSTICLDQWDQNLADVVCHQLGFTLLAEEAFLNFGAVFGEGTGPILDEDLVCSGSEEFVSHCSIVPANIGGCNHSRDASVRCSGEFAWFKQKKAYHPKQHAACVQVVSIGMHSNTIYATLMYFSVN